MSCSSAMKINKRTKGIHSVIAGAVFLLAGLALAAQRPSSLPLPQNDEPPLPDHADVVYAITDGQKLRLDVYEPHKHRVPAPAVVLIHPGAWTSYDRSLMDSDAAELARAGFVAFSIDYRLLNPGHHARNRWPAQLQDCQSAVRWIRQHAAQYHVDPSRIAAYGHSAGGQLAALLGLTDARDPAAPSISSRVRAVVDLAGPSDFTSDHDPDRDALLASLFGGTEAQVAPVWRDASPVLQVGPAAPPFLIVHGTLDQDVPIHQSQELVDALRKAGAQVTFLKVNDDHSLLNANVRDHIVAEAVKFLSAALR